MGKTVVLGASTNPERTSYIATLRLVNAGEEVIPLGVKQGSIAGIDIINDFPDYIENVDTLTLYLNPQRQEQYYDYIIALQPKRIIFNPGTENPVLAKLAQEKGIEAEVACTLVMLATGSY